jgi:hypothetical protein
LTALPLSRADQTFFRRVGEIYSIGITSHLKERLIAALPPGAGILGGGVSELHGRSPGDRGAAFDSFAQGEEKKKRERE